MASVVIIKDDGSFVDITERVELILRDGLPYDWEDWVDQKAVKAICEIAIEFGKGAEGFDERLANSIAVIERVEGYRREAEERVRRQREQQAEREKEREPKRAETDLFLTAFANRWLRGEVAPGSDRTVIS